ncbi:hypothetical protein GGQ86_004056 [Xanthobacter flavus]|uniref:Uncharacterized protein n=1 Tax=Xanthobacter flavus TaxID=281 RepID=A0A9W6CLT1_XANFL|nr:hypothetical protein [Xanthobacter flavus]GLI24763.1 hypothetical protein XFLAVUS301_44370 [Xanthobacter flavus]
MGSGIAAERVENVFLGCAFGRVAVALAEIARPGGGLRPGRPQTPVES